MKRYFEIGEICGKYGIPLVADISMADRQIALVAWRTALEIIRELVELTDIAYASAWK